jgi:hypothetical protein
VSPGSEPERDDTGLPPVDIEIPDDARELDLDVQAYQRELRAVRREQRRTRWHRSLGKDGVVLPLLACFLILALITGTLLTVFTATSEQGLTLPPGSSAASSAGRSALRLVRAREPLPRADITVEGRPAIPLDTLHRAMLVLVPAGCDCASTLGWLVGVAASAHAAAYVVYNQQTRTEVGKLYGQLDAAAKRRLTLASDTATDVLTSKASYPAGIPANQLAAVLVGPERTVYYATRLSASDSKIELVNAITTG